LAEDVGTEPKVASVFTTEAMKRHPLAPEGVTGAVLSAGISINPARIANYSRGRLATAVLMVTDDEWQTEKRYLPKATT
jgi:hypothetical protein